LRKYAWLFVVFLLFLTYYLSSIPGLRVIPVLRQFNILLNRIDLSLSQLAQEIAVRLPEELAPAKTLTRDFMAYAGENPVVIEFILRKIAHVGLFFVITMAFFLLLRYYLKQPWAAVSVSFTAAAVVAVLDEYHQSFVPGRTGSPVDVLINLVGVVLALCLIVLSYFLASTHIKEKEDRQR